MKLDNPLHLLPPQEIAVDVLQEKYAKGDEKTVEDIRSRVARGIAKNEKNPAKWTPFFLDALRAGFIPGGRINSAAGTGIQATLINCFVQDVNDSVTTGDMNHPGIYDALAAAAETMRRGGGVGYDFSKIRPKGAFVKGTSSRASGPLSYMDVFDSSCATVESAGGRRGAQMGVMRCDHPDVLDFITAKRQAGKLRKFNVSVAVTNSFMEAVRDDKEFELVHKAEPAPELKDGGAYQRADGMWVYRKVSAREVWDKIMGSTYDFAEPGVLFIDKINEDNNLSYIEEIRATNPCGEQPLPPYGCCCLGSINLTQYVINPFGDKPHFDFVAFEKTVKNAVRMLDNVLDITVWPLDEQMKEAQAKRRIGLGYLGLGSALVMLKIRYDSEAGLEMIEEITKSLAHSAYRASVDLAKEKGAFPLFDAEKYLAAPHFASRLPEDLKADIRANGIRNSHLVSIAPTGTISLAFADNASNGIEPVFDWSYNRNKIMLDGSKRKIEVDDHAYRLYKHLGGDMTNLPEYFVTAQSMKAIDHMRAVAAALPYIDSAISKTVNVPADYPFEDFKDLYMEAWKSGLKGITTYRPNSTLGAVLEVKASPAAETPNDVSVSQLDIDRCITLQAAPKPALSSLRWPSRPALPGGSEGWASEMIEHQLGDFVVFVSHVKNGVNKPFEVWVNGGEQPRGLGAVAKTLSMDMRAADKAWLDIKLKSLEKVAGDDAFDMPDPPTGDMMRVPSLVSGFAKLVRFRCNVLDALELQEGDKTPVMETLFAKEEPKSGTNGTMSWTVDIYNPATGDDFVLGLKELVLPDGRRCPYSIWLSGDHPRAFDGLCKLLSLDMRVSDVAWIGMKLRKLLNYAEPQGDFMAKVPGSEKSASFPSTVAYIARLVIHRYAMLGLLTEDGNTVETAGILEAPAQAAPSKFNKVQAGKKCDACHVNAVIRKDGCDYCTNCGEIGTCG